MKVVALVSGGKDSCYSAMKCAAYGHEVVALGNLYPEDGIDDADSFMYQTVGHEVIAGYAECFGLPLLRKKTAAQCVRTDLSYEATPGDEVEDLDRLLAMVKAQHADVEAVASGAVLSNYQRLRVENVASRAGLKSLAFLWQRNQRALLREMIDCGVEAIIIKVAAIGLDPHKHLGKTLAEMENYLISLDDKYGVSVCGEGGEYETLVLNCPMFRKRIVIDSCSVHVTSNDPFAPLGHLRVDAYHLEEKEAAVTGEKAVPIRSREGYFLPAPYEREDWKRARKSSDDAASRLRHHIERELVQASCSSEFAFCSVEVAGQGADGMRQALQLVEDRMRSDGFGWNDAFFVTLYISDMDQFGAVNREYCQFLPGSEPAARACLEAGSGTRVDVAFTRRKRRTLHVQSISEWAPPCIGPYAQSNGVGGVVHLAGVIPMFAPTAAVPDDLGPAGQLRACQGNLVPITIASRSSWDAIFAVTAYVAEVSPSCCVYEMTRSLPQAPIACIVPVAGLPRGANVELCCEAFEVEPTAEHRTVSSRWTDDQGAVWVRVDTDVRVFLQVGLRPEAPDELAVSCLLEAQRNGSLVGARIFTSEDTARLRLALSRGCSEAVAVVPTVEEPHMDVDNGDYVPMKFVLQVVTTLDSAYGKM